MRNGVIVDSGPLIALFDADDQHHKRTVNWFRKYPLSGYTTVAVLTEVSHTLRFNRAAQLDFLRWVRAGALEVVDLDGEDFDRCIELMTKFSDLPADFADATLVAIADRLEIPRVATFDGDFHVYRYQSRSPFRLVP